MPLISELPLPDFFDAALADRWTPAAGCHRPDAARLFREAIRCRREHGVALAADATTRIHLLLIDLQKDFCLPEGALYVGGRSGRGAVLDSVRTATFLYRNARAITDVTATFDTHHAHQIFFPSFWVDAGGEPLSEHTLIRVGAGARETLVNTDPAGRVLHEDVRPAPGLAHWLCDGDESRLRAQVLHYCRELERAGRTTLYLWPPHCLLGSEGHALAPLVHEARLFHAFLRGAPAHDEQKGEHPLTENYSVFRPEVLTRADGTALAEKNTRLVETLLRADALVVAGQAASHCVRSSLDDLLLEIEARDPSLARKVYILTDCMSSVAVPDGRGGFLADFTSEAEEAHRRFASAGMHLVRSTAPLASWPGLDR